MEPLGPDSVRHQSERRRAPLNRWPWHSRPAVQSATERGALSKRLVRSGATVICLEPDAGSLAAARHRLEGEHVEFIQDSVEHIPLPDASVDAVVASVTAHHWTDQDVGFAELFRVIRPGGRVVLAEFKSSGPLLRRLRRLAGSKHANAPSLEDWRARLERAGFDEVGTGRGGWVRGFALFIVAVR